MFSSPEESAFTTPVIASVAAAPPASARNCRQPLSPNSIASLFLRLIVMREVTNYPFESFPNSVQNSSKVSPKFGDRRWLKRVHPSSGVGQHVPSRRRIHILAPRNSDEKDKCNRLEATESTNSDLSVEVAPEEIVDEAAIEAIE